MQDSCSSRPIFWAIDSIASPQLKAFSHIVELSMRKVLFRDEKKSDAAAIPTSFKTSRNPTRLMASSKVSIAWS